MGSGEREERDTERTIMRGKLRWPALALSLLAALVASLTLAACASGTGTTAGSATTKIYTNTAFGYSFEYPSSWKVQEQTTADVSAGGTPTGGVGVFNPQGTQAGATYIDLMLVSVYKLNQTISAANLPQVESAVETVLKSLESQGTDMTREKALVQVTAAGMKGYDVTYSFTKNGAPCTSTLYFLFNGNREYQLTIQASNDNWAADQGAFDAMIASFKPGAAKQ